MSKYQDNCITKLNESRQKISFFGRSQRTDQPTRSQSTEIQGNKNPFCISSRFVEKPNSVPNPFATEQRPESKSGNSYNSDRNNGFFSSNMNTLSMPRDNYNPNSNFTQNFVGKSSPFDQNSAFNKNRVPQNLDSNSHTYTNSGQVYRKDQFLQPQKNGVGDQQNNRPLFSVPNINNNNGFIDNHNNNNNNNLISPVSPVSGSAQPNFITGFSNNSTYNQKYGGLNTNYGNTSPYQNMANNQGLSIPRKSINNFQQPTQQSRLIFQQQGQKRQPAISEQIPNNPKQEQRYPQPPFPQITNIPTAPYIKNSQNPPQAMVQNPNMVNNAPGFNLAEYNKLKQQLEGMVNLLLLPLAKAYSQKKKQREQQNQRLLQQHLLQEEQKAGEYRPVWFDDNSDGLFVQKRVCRKQEQERRIIINVVQVKKQTIMKQKYEREQKIKNFHHNYEKNQLRFQNISKFPDDIFNFDLDQEQKIKNIKKSRKDEVNNFEHIQVSQFPDSWKLQYSADLRWLEEPNVIRKTFNKAYVHVSERPSRKEIQQAILLDLRSKGVCFRQNFIYKENDFDFKRYKPNFFMKHLFGKKQREFKEFVVSCTIFQKKINIPPSYKCNLHVFKGFTVKDLEISNQYGSITWEGQTKIQNISFAKGIKISKDEVECQIGELEKQAIVEFNSLPIQTQGKSIIKIQKQLQKLARGAEVIQVDMDRKSWKLKVNLGRQQK